MLMAASYIAFEERIIGAKTFGIPALILHQSARPAADYSLGSCQICTIENAESWNIEKNVQE